MLCYIAVSTYQSARHPDVVIIVIGALGRTCLPIHLNYLHDVSDLGLLRVSIFVTFWSYDLLLQLGQAVRFA